MKKGMIKVDGTVATHILTPDVGPDTQAVLGAKNSRAPNLEQRWADMVGKDDVSVEDWTWDDPPQHVKDFMEQNLAGYGHASIGEMAPLWVENSGFGWPAAWLLLDFPRVITQENSSRVIQQNRVGAGEMCRFAPPEFKPLHDAWMEFYDTLSKRDHEADRAYKFDDKRFALPGTMRTGVGYFNCDSRSTLRHLQQMKGMGGWVANLAEEYAAGAKVYAPSVYRALNGGDDLRTRAPNQCAWHIGLECPPVDLTSDPKSGVSVSTRDSDVFRDNSTSALPLIHRSAELDMVLLDLVSLKLDSNERTNGYIRELGTYIDPYFANLGMFHVEQYVSVGTARDEHRHRMMMPWTLDVVTDNDGIVFAPWTPFEIPKDLRDMTNEAFFAAFENATTLEQKWNALHALPFCALVRMKGQGTLPNLVYKAELRSQTPNAHWEYKMQNEELLRKIANILPVKLATALNLYQYR